MILLLQMVAAVMQEDRYEVSLTISFVTAGPEKQQVGTSLHWDQTRGKRVVSSSSSMSDLVCLLSGRSIRWRRHYGRS